MQNNSKPKYIWIDFLKMLAIIMVMLDHTSFENQRVHPFVSALIVDCAVPIFFILAGYNSARSYEKNKFNTISQWYQIPFISIRIKRLMLTYLGVLIFEVVYKFQIEGLDAFAIWERLYQRGGWGPGSYFPFVMLQITLLIPILLYYSKKNWIATTIGVVVLQVSFESLVNYIHLDSDAYRMLAFRYLTCVLLGIMFRFYGHKLCNFWITGALWSLGLIYLFGVTVLEYQPLIFQHWQVESGILPAFYAFGIVCFVSQSEVYFQKNYHRFRLPQLVGQASYHIFLVQMMYFHFKIPQHLEPLWNGLPISTFASLTICCLFGVLWFKTGLLIKKSAECQNNF